MYAKTGDKGWAEGGIYKTILQGAGAALVAQLGNGEGLNAALGAMASQLASGKVNELAKELTSQLTDDPAAQELLANLLTNLSSDIIGFAGGGESGAVLASIMNRHNMQLHPDQMQWIKKNTDGLRQRLHDLYPDMVFTNDELASLMTVISLGKMIPGGQLNLDFRQHTEFYLPPIFSTIHIIPTGSELQ